MRKFTKVLGLASLALLATQAQAADVAPATGTVLVDGFVTARCALTLDNAVIHLGELAQQSTGATGGKLDTSKVNGKNATLTGWCNSGDADVSVEAFPLLNSAPDNASFDNRVDYTATAAFGNASPTDTTLTAGSGQPQSGGSLLNGNIVVTLSSASSPNSGVMVAGDYGGSVVVTLTPKAALQVAD